MPYCEVGRHADGDKWEGVRLFYRRYGRGATKVLLIIGTHAADLSRASIERRKRNPVPFSRVV